MKKVVIILTIIIVILVGVLGFFGIQLKKSNVKISDILSSKKEVVVVETAAKNYGNRGNISQTERIKFLSQDDEYVVGMIGLEKSSLEKNFSNEDMIRFALNVATYRYKSILDTKKTQKGTTGYVVPTAMLNEITNEFFGISNVHFDQKNDKYYSRTYKAFLFDESIEKSLYYYPVSMEKIEVEKELMNADQVAATPSTSPSTSASTTPETSPEATSEIVVQTPKDEFTFITVDAIFVPDVNTDEFEKAKYEGAYEEKDVDNTIKFKFNSFGKLVSYQNM